MKDITNFTPLRWGILGCGSIANRLGADIVRLGDHKLQAIASRDPSRAADYAAKFDVPTRHTGTNAYTALVADPDVDLVYVATPHNFHKDQVLMALAAGKPVLCEKPFAVNTAEAEIIVATARKAGLFLMEGVWSRCFPVWRRVLECIAGGDIGHARMLYSDFGFRAADLGPDHRLTGYDAEARLFNPSLAGGALMDVGVYPISIAQMVFGNPVDVKAVGVRGNSGVDENVAVVLAFAEGQVATATTSLQVTTPSTTTILGTSGRMEVESPWWRPKIFRIYRDGKEAERIEFEHVGEGFQFEAMEVASCLREGRTESCVMPLDDTIAVMRTLDAVRAQLGLKFPMEGC